MRSNDERSRRTESNWTGAIGKKIGEQLLSRAFDNPLMLLIMIPVLLVLVFVLPVVVGNLILSAVIGTFYSIHPVVGFLAVLVIFGAVIGVVGKRLASLAGYELSYIRQLNKLLSAANVGSLAPVPALAAVLPAALTTGPRGDTDSSGDDTFWLPFSELNRNEMRGYSNRVGMPWVPLARNYSTLVLGEPGAGKTTTINLLLRQMNADPDEPVVIFDYKGEFDQDALFPGRELTRLSVTGNDNNWNVFREAETEDDYREIANRLVTEDTDNQNEFFLKASRDVLEAAMIHLDREHLHPTNRELVEFFRQPQRDIHDALNQYDNLGQAARMTAGETGRDALMTLSQFVKDTFTDSFAEVGGFSVRDYMREPDGRVLVIQADMAKFETTKPAIRFLVDWAIQHGLQDGSRNAYFVLDEFQRLPNVENIENLTGAGRAQQAQAILGLQSVSQLEASYDEGLADAIVAGATQEILMRPGDQRSVEHIQQAVGTVRQDIAKDAPEFGRKEYTQQEYVEYSARELRQLRVGDAIVKTPDGFVEGRVKQWADLSADERERLSGF